MKSVIQGALLLAAATATAASPARRQASNSTCTSPSVRVPWQNLTDTEKSSYIKADLCLINAPSQSGLEGAVSRWDDLQYPHVSQTATVHGVGAFLPWHRYYLVIHERLIRKECGYTGRMPYWDELNDLPDMVKSGIFEPTAFGGDGDPSQDYCITDGPFVNMTLRWNSSIMTTDEHCLTRQRSLESFTTAEQSYIDTGNSIQNYSDYQSYAFSTGPHTAGHAGVGKIMADATLSPGDPVFYLHHSYLDKIWWEWQQLDWPARKYDMGGTNIQGFGGSIPGGNTTVPPGFPLPGNGSSGIPSSGDGVDQGAKDEYVNYFNDNGGNVTTLNHTLFYDGLTDIAPNATIADVMDLFDDVICIDYL